MDTTKQFSAFINDGYASKGDSIILGGAMLNGKCIPDTLVKVPLKTLNRHGLIAGATGTGKTKSLQVLAEQLSEKGVPVVMMDLKGDLSGLAAPGTVKDFITERHQLIGIPYSPMGMPVELLTLSDEKGVRLRATITEFGPVLISKILELNDTQGGVMSLVFKYCDDNQLPLVDLKDLKKVLQYVIGEGKELITAEYGAVSAPTVNTIIRKLIELEQQGAERFFGEPSFDVHDLLRTTPDGKGYISIIRLTDIQDRPKMFSTFMLSLMAEVYAQFPESGDSVKPKLIFFIDEAHIIFDQASKALIDQIESIIKLIRSKGVGIYFCTQNPADVPDAILGQLGLKVQHALRAFTAKDRKDIKQAAENYPISPYYKTDEALTSLGIGEALVTALNEKGIPTPLAITCMRAPMSRMDVLSSEEINQLVGKSELVRKYEKTIDAQSAFEILKAKIENASQEMVRQEKTVISKKGDEKREEKSLIEELSKNTMVRQIGRTIAREAFRGLLGAIGVRSRR